MIDLRNLTDHERALHFRSMIPDWIYFIPFFGVGFWFVIGLPATLARAWWVEI